MLHTHEVTGSSPVVSTKKKTTPFGVVFLFGSDAGLEPIAVQVSGGERTERCRWQKKRGERVAAVDQIEAKRKPEDLIGHRNRDTFFSPGKSPWGTTAAGMADGCAPL